jgi:hypothetical protein
MNLCNIFDSDSEDELSNSSDDNSEEDVTIHIKKITSRKLGLYMHKLSQSIDSDSSNESDDEQMRKIFTYVGIYMHQISCEKDIYKSLMEEVFKELLSYFKNYISDSDSDSDSDLFFYLSEDEE